MLWLILHIDLHIVVDAVILDVLGRVIVEVWVFATEQCLQGDRPIIFLRLRHVLVLLVGQIQVALDDGRGVLEVCTLLGALAAHTAVPIGE